MNHPTHHVKVDLGARSYSIAIGESLWEYLGESIDRLLHPTCVAVITDDVVGPLYKPSLMKAFSSQGWKVSVHSMKAGEPHKTLATVTKLYSEILDAGCDRRTPVVALGGGVPGDTAGFVAATLLRGVPYVQVPTTLLAMVDSSVGGKTGVDMPQGKNLVGAFHQPCLVVISVDTLETLCDREFAAGMAEVIKYGVIYDAPFFEDLEESVEDLMKGNSEKRMDIIRRCCEIKAEVVSKDERESGLRAILNFGHTVGHAIETASEYGTFLHGEGVAIGMMVETAIAEVRGTDVGNLRERLRRILTIAGLPVAPPLFDLDRIWSLMHADKKALGGEIRMVLPECLGAVSVQGGITFESFREAWYACRKQSQSE